MTADNTVSFSPAVLAAAVFELWNDRRQHGQLLTRCACRSSFRIVERPQTTRSASHPLCLPQQFSNCGTTADNTVSFSPAVLAAAVFELWNDRRQHGQLLTRCACRSSFRIVEWPQTTRSASHPLCFRSCRVDCPTPSFARHSRDTPIMNMHPYPTRLQPLSLTAFTGGLRCGSTVFRVIYPGCCAYPCSDGQTSTETPVDRVYNVEWQCLRVATFLIKQSLPVRV